MIPMRHVTVDDDFCTVLAAVCVLGGINRPPGTSKSEIPLYVVCALRRISPLGRVSHAFLEAAAPVLGRVHDLLSALPDAPRARARLAADLVRYADQTLTPADKPLTWRRLAASTRKGGYR